MARVRAQFAYQHFRGPLWITEHGYPAATATNAILTTKGGERACVRYLQRHQCRSPALNKSSSPYATAPRRNSATASSPPARVLRPASDEPYPVRRKRSYWLVRRLAGLSPATPATARK